MGIIATDILNGEFDAELDEIREATLARSKMLGKMNASAVKIGDTVKFSDRIRPKYLIGLTATVVKINRESITVNCPDDPDYGRFQNCKRVRCPKDLIAGA